MAAHLNPLWFQGLSNCDQSDKYSLDGTTRHKCSSHDGWDCKGSPSEQISSPGGLGRHLSQCRYNEFSMCATIVTSTYGLDSESNHDPCTLLEILM